MKTVFIVFSPYIALPKCWNSWNSQSASCWPRLGKTGSYYIECFQTIQDNHFIYLVLIIHWIAGEENMDRRDLQKPHHFSLCFGTYVLPKMKNIKECMPEFRFASWISGPLVVFACLSYKSWKKYFIANLPHDYNWVRNLSCWAKQLSTDTLCYTVYLLKNYNSGSPSSSC